MKLPKLIFYCLIYTTLLFAKKNISFEYKGRINTGLSSYIDNSATPIARILQSKISFRLDIKKKYYGRIDLDADISDPSINLGTLYIGYKISTNHLIRTGYLKKFFGNEETASLSKLLNIERSLLNYYVTAMGAFGKDSAIQYLGNFKKKYKLYFGVSLDGDGRFSINNRHKFAIKDLNLGLSGLWTYHYEYHNFFMGAIDLKLKKKVFGLESELFLGKDPNASDLYSILNNKVRNIYFSGVRFLPFLRINLPGKIFNRIEPNLCVSLIFKDLSNLRYQYLQLKPGLNVVFGKKKHLRLMFNGDFNYANTMYNNKYKRELVFICSQIQLSW